MGSEHSGFDSIAYWASPRGREALLHMVNRALTEDVPMQPVLETLERALLASAMTRHVSQREAYEALKVPRASFFVKKRRYFEHP